MPDGLTLSQPEVHVLAGAYFEGNPQALDEAGAIISALLDNAAEETLKGTLYLHCPVCQFQYADIREGAPTRCPNGPAALVDGGRTQPFKRDGHGAEGYANWHTGGRGVSTHSDETERGS
jgi:hypothetical protein